MSIGPASPLIELAGTPRAMSQVVNAAQSEHAAHARRLASDARADAAAGVTEPGADPEIGDSDAARSGWETTSASGRDKEPAESNDSPEPTSEFGLGRGLDLTA